MVETRSPAALSRSKAALSSGVRAATSAGVSTSRATAALSWLAERRTSSITSRRLSLSDIASAGMARCTTRSMTSGWAMPQSSSTRSAGTAVNSATFQP